MSKYNTGSDLDIEKMQKAFTVVNGRIGLTGGLASGKSTVASHLKELGVPEKK